MLTISQKARAYITCTEPLDTPMANPGGNPLAHFNTTTGCPVLSSGESYHTELTLISAQSTVLAWMNDVYAVDCGRAYKNPVLNVTFSSEEVEISESQDPPALEGSPVKIQAFDEDQKPADETHKEKIRETMTGKIKLQHKVDKAEAEEPKLQAKNEELRNKTDKVEKFTVRAFKVKNSGADESKVETPNLDRYKHDERCCWKVTDKATKDQLPVKCHVEKMPEKATKWLGEVEQQIIKWLGEAHSLLDAELIGAKMTVLKLSVESKRLSDAKKKLDEAQRRFLEWQAIAMGFNSNLELSDKLLVRANDLFDHAYSLETAAEGPLDQLLQIAVEVGKDTQEVKALRVVVQSLKWTEDKPEETESVQKLRETVELFDNKVGNLMWQSGKPESPNERTRVEYAASMKVCEAAREFHASQLALHASAFQVLAKIKQDATKAKKQTKTGRPKADEVQVGKATTAESSSVAGGGQDCFSREAVVDEPKQDEEKAFL